MIVAEKPRAQFAEPVSSSCSKKLPASSVQVTVPLAFGGIRQDCRGRLNDGAILAWGKDQGELATVVGARVDSVQDVLATGRHREAVADPIRGCADRHPRIPEYVGRGVGSGHVSGRGGG